MKTFGDSDPANTAKNDADGRNWPELVCAIGLAPHAYAPRICTAMVHNSIKGTSPTDDALATGRWSPLYDRIRGGLSIEYSHTKFQKWP
jgi:hypothetical protein